MRFKPGDTAFILESNLFIREVKVLSVSGGFVLIQIKGDSGRLNLRVSRLFATKDEAIASAKKNYPYRRFP